MMQDRGARNEDIYNVRMNIFKILNDDEQEELLEAENMFVELFKRADEFEQ